MNKLQNMENFKLYKVSDTDENEVYYLPVPTRDENDNIVVDPKERYVMVGYTLKPEQMSNFNQEYIDKMSGKLQYSWDVLEYERDNPDIVSIQEVEDSKITERLLLECASLKKEQDMERLERGYN